MRIGTITLLVTVYVSFSRPALGQDQPSGPLPAALGFFDHVASGDIDSTLRGLRKTPLSSEERDLTRAMLHLEKPLVPTAAEVKKLDALKPILIYHERDHAFDIDLLDVPQAFIGLRARVILVVSRPAIKVLTASELQALAAHELGHELLWATRDEIPPGRARQELELKCDGIAALTLLTLGLEPMRVVEAAKKLANFNQQFGVAPNAADYPTLRDRKQLVTALINRPWAKKRTTSMRSLVFAQPRTEDVSGIPRNPNAGTFQSTLELKSDSHRRSVSTPLIRTLSIASSSSGSSIRPGALAPSREGRMGPLRWPRDTPE
jgi:hypothetical protein